MVDEVSEPAAPFCIVDGLVGPAGPPLPWRTRVSTRIHAACLLSIYLLRSWDPSARRVRLPAYDLEGHGWFGIQYSCWALSSCVL